MDSYPQDYRAILAREFSKRTARNPRYSLRAFARGLGLDPRHLDGILKGSKGLSSTKAEIVADRLACTPTTRAFFIASVRAEDGRGRAERTAAKRNLDELQGSGVLKRIELEFDQVELVSDWIGIAVHEYLKSHPGTTEAKLIRVFHEPKERIQAALSCLESLNLVTQRSGRFTARDVNIFSSDEIPSPALRNGQRSLLRRAERSLMEDSVEGRDFFSLIMNVVPEELPDAKKMIRQFLNQFHNRFSKETQSAEVMSLALQLVPLSKREGVSK